MSASSADIDNLGLVKLNANTALDQPLSAKHMMVRRVWSSFVLENAVAGM